MPIDCLWFDEKPEGPWQPGWCFPNPFGDNWLSPVFVETVHDRPAIVVCLPMRHAVPNAQNRYEHTTWFCIDSSPTSEPGGHWDVTVDLATLVDGEKPDITVQPSINCVGLYHGYVTHGVVGPDLDAAASSS